MHKLVLPLVWPSRWQRMMGLSTPRQVIGEITNSKGKPAHAREFLQEVEELLKERGLLDIYMSASNVDALLKEVGDAVVKDARRVGAMLR